MAVASPPASWISRTTVLIVDCEEFGSGGNGDALDASETVLAATTTVESYVRTDEVAGKMPWVFFYHYDHFYSHVSDADNKVMDQGKLHN
jgi:hypothetical protein